MLIFAGCSLGLAPEPNEKPENNTTGSTISGEESNTIPDESDNFFWSGNDIVLNLKQDQQQVIVPIQHNAKERNTVYFDNTNFKSVHIFIDFLDHTGPVNYRFSQVTLPDGSWDGPFGRNTTYPLNQTGLYQFHFHESMMAGDPRTGDATINFEFSTEAITGVIVSMQASARM